MQKLKIPCKEWFLTKQIAAWKCTTCVRPKGPTEFLWGIYHTPVYIPEVRKTFGIRMANSLKLSFPAHFKNTENNISHNFYSFNLTVGLLKMYIFLLLNVLSIPFNNYISRTNFEHYTGYFWNFLISHVIQNYWKKTSSITGLSVSV